MKMGRTTALLTVALVLAGCDNTPADLHGLPADAAERATLCGRAAVAFRAASPDGDTVEKTRRQELLQQVINDTGFFSATGLDENQGRALLGDIEATLKGGNWLGTLNQCKAAYALGDAEPLPDLPADAGERPAACAAIAVVSAFGEAEDLGAIQKMVLTDPRSSYFLIAAANQDGGIAQAQNNMTKHVAWAIASGAVGPLTAACVKEYPKAAADTAVILPADDGQAVAACGFNAGLLGGLDGEEGTKAKAMLARVQGSDILPDLALSNSPKKLLEQALDLGPPANVLTACEARFK